ncbi:MAG: hypothetical protein Q8M92_05955 [Candidatus Subteraquimicrobiales bacterium]|nr:hypothetical protein [Candidatus Subteraquimicrobiales bacterium]
MSEICSTCPSKERLFCANSHILEEDIPEILKTYYLKEYTLKNSIKTKRGIDELYNLLLIEKRKGQYLALSFSNFPCSMCEICTLEHHMKVGYTKCSNRKLVRCIGLLNIQPMKDENKAWILLKK